MKTFFKMNSLKKRLMTILLVVSIIPLVITIAVIFFTTSNGFDKLITNQQADMEHLVQSEFNKVAEDLQGITRIYAQNLPLVEAFHEKDRDQLLRLVSDVYPKLFSEHGIDVIEYGDTEGFVFLRGHNTTKFGDDKGDMAAIQHALEGESISGFEFGNSGLSVRSFSPIYYDKEVIGTLQMGVDDSFLVDLNEKLQGVTIDLYNAEGKVVESSDEANIGATISNDSIFASVNGGKKVSEHDDQTLNSYLPMVDPTGNEIIGIIGITQDISTIQQTNQQITWIGLVSTIIAVIVVLVVSIIFSRSVVNPIRTIAELMVELSKGNLRLAIKDSKWNDETGQLTTAMQTMRDNLHDTLTKVAAASTNVAAQSEELTQSAVEVKSGSEQIAMTMQEIAAGTEKEADNASAMVSTMGSFTTIIEETNHKGEQIRSATLEVIEMTNEGQRLMHLSDAQMVTIDEIVQDAVTKMAQLDNQSQEISKLVEVIQKIANQTNLLALNAAIEAARAGDAGKGFAVVADEVRKLAEQVSSSVTDITGFVSNIQLESNNVATSLKKGYQEVERGTTQIKITGDTFNQISASVTEMVESIQGISGHLSEISASSREMDAAIEEIAAVSEESAAGVEEVAATAEQSSSSMEEISGGSEQLAKLAEEMNQLVAKFKL